MPGLKQTDESPPGLVTVMSSETDILKAELPARWSSKQRLKNTLIYHVVRALFALLEWFPLSLSRVAFKWLGRLGYHVANRERNQAIAQLEQSLEDCEPSRARSITRGMFAHFGELAAELTHVGELLEHHPDLRFTDEHRALFEEALAEGNGVIAVTGHIGNWELLAQLIAREGFDLTSVARPTYDPRLTKWVHQRRSAYGMRVLWRGERDSPKELLRVFRNNAILGLLIDQDTRVHGEFVPFFGRLAYTPSAASSLSLRLKAPIIIGWLHRTPSGYQLHFERHHFEAGDDREADIRTLTGELTERLEAAIRHTPEQWVWLHQRWKTRPPELHEAGQEE